MVNATVPVVQGIAGQVNAAPKAEFGVGGEVLDI